MMSMQCAAVFAMMGCAVVTAQELQCGAGATGMQVDFSCCSDNTGAAGQYTDFDCTTTSQQLISSSALTSQTQFLKDDGSCTWDRSEDGVKSPSESCATAEVCCEDITGPPPPPPADLSNLPPVGRGACNGISLPNFYETGFRSFHMQRDSSELAIDPFETWVGPDRDSMQFTADGDFVAGQEFGHWSGTCCPATGSSSDPCQELDPCLGAFSVPLDFCAPGTCAKHQDPNPDGSYSGQLAWDSRASCAGSEEGYCPGGPSCMVMAVDADGVETTFVADPCPHQCEDGYMGGLIYCADKHGPLSERLEGEPDSLQAVERGPYDPDNRCSEWCDTSYSECEYPEECRGHEPLDTDSVEWVVTSCVEGAGASGGGETAPRKTASAGAATVGMAMMTLAAAAVL